MTIPWISDLPTLPRTPLCLHNCVVKLTNFQFTVRKAEKQNLKFILNGEFRFLNNDSVMAVVRESEKEVSQDSPRSSSNK